MNLLDEFKFCQTNKQIRYEQTEIFHQSFQYIPSSLSDFIHSYNFYKLYNNICSWMLKIKLLIYIYIYALNFKKEMHSFVQVILWNWP